MATTNLFPGSVSLFLTSTDFVTIGNIALNESASQNKTDSYLNPNCVTAHACLQQSEPLFLICRLGLINAPSQLLCRLNKTVSAYGHSAHRPVMVGSYFCEGRWSEKQIIAMQLYNCCNQVFPMGFETGHGFLRNHSVILLCSQELTEQVLTDSGAGTLAAEAGPWVVGRWSWNFQEWWSCYKNLSDQGPRFCAPSTSQVKLINAVTTLNLSVFICEVVLMTTVGMHWGPAMCRTLFSVFIFLHSLNLHNSPMKLLLVSHSHFADREGVAQGG